MHKTVVPAHLVYVVVLVFIGNTLRVWDGGVLDERGSHLVYVVGLMFVSNNVRGFGRCGVLDERGGQKGETQYVSPPNSFAFMSPDNFVHHFRLFIRFDSLFTAFLSTHHPFSCLEHILGRSDRLFAHQAAYDAAAYRVHRVSAHG